MSNTDNNVTPIAVVQVQSGWLSKINWTQAIGIISSLLVFAFGPSAALTPEQQVAIITVINLIQGAVTFIYRQWFNSSVTPAVAASQPVKANMSMAIRMGRFKI